MYPDNVHRIQTDTLSLESAAVFFNGRAYHAMNHFDCMEEALADDKKTFLSEYGIDPINEKDDAIAHINNEIFAKPGNNILGVDILRNSRTRFFVVKFKHDWFQNQNRLLEYCAQNGFTLAFYSQDKPGMIVPTQ